MIGDGGVSLSDVAGTSRVSTRPVAALEPPCSSSIGSSGTWESERVSVRGRATGTSPTTERWMTVRAGIPPVARRTASS